MSGPARAGLPRSGGASSARARCCGALKGEAGFSRARPTARAAPGRECGLSAESVSLGAEGGLSAAEDAAAECVGGGAGSVFGVAGGGESAAGLIGMGIAARYQFDADAALAAHDSAFRLARRQREQVPRRPVRSRFEGQTSSVLGQPPELGDCSFPGSWVTPPWMPTRLLSRQGVARPKAARQAIAIAGVA